MTGVELLIGGWFASPAIGRVLEKVQKYLGANYELQKATQEMVMELAGTLLLCKATLMEVQKVAIIKNQALADWLRILKETVYDAEDVLDNMEARSIKEEVQGKNKVSKLASSSYSTAGNMFVPAVDLKSLKMVLAQLKKLSDDIPKFFNLVIMNEKSESHTREVNVPRETISQPLFGKVGLYGRQDELNLILKIILGSESESRKKGGHVIPIVGMGGVGKTALAQAVYNRTEVQKTFEKREWISVSNNPDVKSVLRKIYQSLGYSSPDSNTLEDIFMNITSCIGGVGKFLIVLDDMFEMIEYEWQFLSESLSHCAPGSVVLITTQNQVFANRVGICGPIALSTLNSGIFWELFERFAFGNLVIPEKKRIILKSIGKKIAKKLGGLPLAAKIIGNILRSNMDEDRWRDISKCEWWDIPEGKSRILPTIARGYEQLDPCLRQCFAYCSLFPRNSLIDQSEKNKKSLIEKDKLVHMWIAQNFIQCDVKGVMGLEDIGKQWFDELVEKSFFQPAGDNNSYVMHDLMHDLAVIVSSGECFYIGEGVDDIPLGVRHLAVDTNNLEVIRGIQNHKNLRSFLYFGSHQVEGMYRAIHETLYGLDSIRVLDLSYLCMEKEIKPPYNIWNLKHLRYLHLSSTGIRFLAHSVDLCHLQSLHIQNCLSVDQLPLPMKKPLPNLINLRHLCADEETIAKISGIGNLTNLQELGVFVVGNKEGHRITELRNLREIKGTLIIKNIENIRNNDEAMLANLVDKKHLDSICIYSSTTERKSNVDMEVLEKLQPHKDIKHLTISGYAGSHFPNWIIQIGDFLNINTLYLISCVNVEVLPPLGQLPSLKFLHMEKLSSVKLIDYHLYGKKHTIFPHLEELVLKTSSKCEKWTDDAQARELFPRLSKLTIENNKNLREAPLALFSSSLEELKIHGCERLISLERPIPRLVSLTRFELYPFAARVSFDPLDMQSLEDLNLTNCWKLEISGDLQSLTHLKRLSLVCCPKLFSRYSTMDQQKEKGLQVHKGLRSLTHIEADSSLLHHEFHLILGDLPSLRILKFSEITRFTKHQIAWFQNLTALQEIHFSICKFEHLPASLTHLPSLEKVVLEECTKLESLSDSMPPNLQELTLRDCSQNLVQLCKAYEGSMADLAFSQQQIISSIPVIHIDDITRCEGQIPDAREMRSMKIWKPFTDAVGRACNSCGKTFELTDLVLHNWY